MEGTERVMRACAGRNRQHGLTLAEVLISSAILAALMAGGLVLSNAITETSATSLTARSLSQDARYALTTLKDDLNVISRAGSLADPDDPGLGFRSDDNRSGSIVLSLTPDAAPHDRITYYLDDTTLYRFHNHTLTPLALNVSDLTATITDPRIDISLTFARDHQAHHHFVSGRFKNP